MTGHVPMTDHDDLATELVDVIRAELPHDYVGLWGVVMSARRLLGDGASEHVRELALDAIRRVLISGEAIAGHPTSDGRFAPWAVKPGDAIARIEREWAKLGRDPDIGEVAWLAGTADIDVA